MIVIFSLFLGDIYNFLVIVCIERGSNIFMFRFVKFGKKSVLGDGGENNDVERISVYIFWFMVFLIEWNNRKIVYFFLWEIFILLKAYV